MTAPSPIAQTFDLPHAVPDVLAVGAFLKATVCVMHGRTASVSETIGDLDSPEAIRRFEDTVARMLADTGADPVIVAHDLHPDFHSTRYAQSLGKPTLAVQHHVAHMGALAAEHGHTAPFLGLALDGFGLGPDAESWGGEMLHLDGADWRRLGHLARLPQPGGDIAAREPWRMAAAALHSLGRGAEIPARFAAFPPAALLGQMLDRGLNSPPTSSGGRLFDAACGLLGVKPVATFEGEAPMALERMVTRPRVLDGGWVIRDGVLDLAPLLAHLADMTDAAAGADLFHGTLAAALADWARAGAAQAGTDTVALGGGCFFNAVLRGELVPRLRAAGLTPLVPTRTSPGDPAISLGQAWIAAHATRRA